MDLRTAPVRPGDGGNRHGQAPLLRRAAQLSPWLLAGMTLTLAMGVVATELHHIASIDPASEALGGDMWWHSPVLLAALMAGMIMTATATVLVHQRQMLGQERDRSWRHAHGYGEIRMISGNIGQKTWQSLRDTDIIDGHALWDAEDRLIDFSGFLGRYIPHLADWREPTGRQVMAALVDGGLMTLMPGMDREQTIDAYTAQRHKIPGLREYHMADGQVFQARTIALGHGQSASIYTNVTDIRRSREGMLDGDTFRRVFDQAPSAKLLLDANRRPLASNRAFLTLLGYTAESLPQLGWNGLLHPEEPADLPPWSTGIHRLITATGETVRAAIGVQRLSDDLTRNATGFLVSFEDVTARWEAEERQRLQAAVLDQLNHAVLVVDRMGRVTYGNQAMRALFQWSDSVLIGTPVERLLGPATRRALEECGGEVETEGVTWNGTSFPAQVGLHHMGDASPLPGGAILTVADLTQRRALDLQLMHSARLATLGEMAASIAHEFNQCLHVIRLASEAVQLDIGDGHLDPTRLGARAANILSQVDRLTEMVTHMRTISRRETQDKHPFQPQAAVDAALRMVEPLLMVDGIRVVRQGRLDGVQVLGHQVRLEQVLLNLLNNGRDAIRERFRRQGNTGGTLTITCATSTDASRVSIAVRDDGTGIASAVGAHIFEPFVTTKDGGNGLGLGLSISRGICTEMGGSLTFGNVDGGAEFVIDLPLAQGEEVLSCAELVVPPPSGGWSSEANDNDGHDSDDDPGDERRVLLVDDEALSVMMVAEFLHRQGYVVDTAYDGLEAYELCQTHVYHAVVTDIRMPRMNGHELIAKLEELQPGTPVIVVTGHLKESNAAELGGNVVALLAKPFQLQDLREQLMRLDGNSELRQQEGG
jgi:PAS domain S-box-containing protein